MKAKHILITGGAGFIGSHLAEKLLSDGNRVTAVDNFDPFYPRALKEENVALLQKWPAFHLVEGDVSDPATFASFLNRPGFDAIAHHAGKAGVRASIEHPVGYQRANVMGTQTVLECARRWGVEQFIFASSSSVYGTNPAVPWSEGSNCSEPATPYAWSKLAGEMLGHVYAQIYGIRFLALRFLTVYGPRQRPDLAIRKYAELMLANEPIPVFGTGRSSRDYTYIDDIVAGIASALEYDRSAYEVINLGNSHPVELHDMIGILEEQMGLRAQRRYLPEQLGDLHSTYADIDKAGHLLGYQPQHSLRQGMAKFVSWLEQERSFREPGKQFFEGARGRA